MYFCLLRMVSYTFSLASRVLLYPAVLTSSLGSVEKNLYGCFDLVIDLSFVFIEYSRFKESFPCDSESVGRVI